MKTKTKEIDVNDSKTNWVNMPEFKAELIKPFRKLVVHFHDQAGVDAFEKLVKQKLGKQPSIGFPERIVRTYSDKHYVQVEK